MWRYKEAEGRKDEDPKCIVSQKGLEAVDRGYCSWRIRTAGTNTTE